MGKPEDRLHAHGEQHREERRGDASQSGDARESARADRDGEQRQDRNRRGRHIERRKRLDQRPGLFVKVRSGSRGVQAEEVLPLPGPDDDRDARRESGDDRARNELDDAAELREPHHQQHAAGHERGDLQAANAVLCGDAGEHGDECAGGPGNLHARAAEQ